MHRTHCLAPVARAPGAVACSPRATPGGRRSAAVWPLVRPDDGDSQYTISATHSADFEHCANTPTRNVPCAASYSQYTRKVVHTLALDGAAPTPGLDFSAAAPAGPPLTGRTACGAHQASLDETLGVGEVAPPTLGACASRPFHPGGACSDDAPQGTGSCCGPRPIGMASDGDGWARVGACSPLPGDAGVACTGELPPGTPSSRGPGPSGMTGNGPTGMPSVAPRGESARDAGPAAGSGMCALGPDGPGGAPTPFAAQLLGSATGRWTAAFEACSESPVFPHGCIVTATGFSATAGNAAATIHVPASGDPGLRPSGAWVSSGLCTGATGLRQQDQPSLLSPVPWSLRPLERHVPVRPVNPIAPSAAPHALPEAPCALTSSASRSSDSSPCPPARSPLAPRRPQAGSRSTSPPSSCRA